MSKPLLPLSLWIGLCAAVGPAWGEDAPPAAVMRSSLFEFAPGDRMEDSGVMVVTGGRFDRTEAFEVVRTAEGGRRLSSVTVGAGDAYRVEGRWDYADDDRALGATGRGLYGGQAVTVVMRREAGDRASITLRGSGEPVVHTAPCTACLMDMSPSALPMFTMTRLYDAERGGAQVFRWIGRSLILDQVLLDGQSEITRLGEFEFAHDGTTTPVTQYVFVENLRDEASGQYFKVAFNLYVDAQQRPLAFATAGSTVGERAGYEGLTTALPKQIPALD